MSIDQTIAQIITQKKQELEVTKESTPDYIEKIKTRVIYYCRLQLKNTCLTIKEIIENAVLKYCLHRF